MATTRTHELRTAYADEETWTSDEASGSLTFDLADHRKIGVDVKPATGTVDVAVTAVRTRAPGATTISLATVSGSSGYDAVFEGPWALVTLAWSNASAALTINRRASS
ncbi:MAG: hypothetical protein AMXMBFR64_05160 [Myxococcales bacterium]